MDPLGSGRLDQDYVDYLFEADYLIHFIRVLEQNALPIQLALSQQVLL